MDGRRGGVRRTTNVTVVVIQGDAFASFDLEALGARLREAHRDGRGGVLVLNDNADTTGRNRCVVEGSAGGGSDSNGSVGERPDERRRDGDIRHKVSKYGSC